MPLVVWFAGTWDARGGDVDLLLELHAPVAEPAMFSAVALWVMTALRSKGWSASTSLTPKAIAG